uniref:Uncharacterized protein n=1 Tax=Parascaris univalens TaxID=6257 RepID=A0A914ZS33_PARUN
TEVSANKRIIGVQSELDVADAGMAKTELEMTVPIVDEATTIYNDGAEVGFPIEWDASCNSASSSVDLQAERNTEHPKSPAYPLDVGTTFVEMVSTNDLVGKVALIAGANCKLGRECASLFLKLGASIVLSDSSEGELQEIVSSLRSDQKSILAYATRANLQEDAEELLSFVHQNHCRLDIFVNILKPPNERTLLNTSYIELKRALDDSVCSFFLFLQVFTPLIIASKGSFINVSSSSSFVSMPHSSFIHRVTKAATNELMRSASAELCSEGVRINSVEVKLPSIEVTPGHDASTAANDDGLSVHIARALNAIMFLLSPAATGVTGICIPVDGYSDEDFNEHKRQSAKVEYNISEDDSMRNQPDASRLQLMRAEKLHIFRKKSRKYIIMRAHSTKQPVHRKVRSERVASMENDFKQRTTSGYSVVRNVEDVAESDETSGPSCSSSFAQEAPMIERESPRRSSLYSLRKSTLRSAGRVKCLLSAKQTPYQFVTSKLRTYRKGIDGEMGESNTKRLLESNECPPVKGKEIDEETLNKTSFHDATDIEEVNTANVHESSCEDSTVMEGEMSRTENLKSMEPLSKSKHEEMLARIAEITSAHVYKCSYIHLQRDVPLKLLSSSEIVADAIKVNRSVPLLHLNGTNQSIRVSFIVDTGSLIPSDLGEDGLGSWNSKGGHRSTTRKCFYDCHLLHCNLRNCGRYEYCLISQRFVHSFCMPPFSVRKIIYQMRRRNGTKCRYALITYSIHAGANIVIDVPLKRRKLPRTPQQLSQEDPPDEGTMDAVISRITKNPIFKKSYINVLGDVNPDFLLSEIDEGLVCKEVPELDLQQIPSNATVRLSFLIDTTFVSPYSLNTDSLGVWNEGSRRMNIRKFFFSYTKGKCCEGEHDFVLYRRYYLHPDSTPDAIVRKTVWLASIEGLYCRYALLSYEIRRNAMILAASQRKTIMNRSTRRDTKSREMPDVRKRLELMENTVRLEHDSAGEPHKKVEEGYSYESLMHRMSQPSYRHFTQPYHNNEPFTLMLLGDVSVGHTCCASCGMEFGIYVHPSEDLVLEHIERFWNQRTETYSTQQMQKKYLHARIDCVLSRYDYFTTFGFLKIPLKVHSRLNESHRQYLVDEFGCIFE